MNTPKKVYQRLMGVRLTLKPFMMWINESMGFVPA
jgi:hypothetical protein